MRPASRRPARRTAPALIVVAAILLLVVPAASAAVPCNAAVDGMIDGVSVANPDWHSPNDRVSTFDWPYYAGVTQSLVGLAAHQVRIQ